MGNFYAKIKIINSVKETDMIKILFVCHGNICRSPMAEFIMKNMIEQKGLSDVIYVESAATSTEELGNDIHNGTGRILIKYGIPFIKRSARTVIKADYDKFSHIILMDSYNLRNIKRIIPSDPDNKIRLLMDYTNEKGRSVADPWYTDDFETTYRDISEGCKAMLSCLIKEI